MSLIVRNTVKCSSLISKLESCPVHGPLAVDPHPMPNSLQSQSNGNRIYNFDLVPQWASSLVWVESKGCLNLYGGHLQTVILVQAVCAHRSSSRRTANILGEIMRLPPNCAQIIPATNRSYILLNAIQTNIIQLSNNVNNQVFSHFYRPIYRGSLKFPTEKSSRITLYT